MKKKLYLLLGIMVSVLLLTGTSAGAKKKQIGKFTYTYKKLDAKSCSLSKISVKDGYFDVLKIPAKINELTVAEIATEDEKNIFGAYSDCEGNVTGIFIPRLKKIILPNTIEKIGSNCFHYIKNLREVVAGSRISEGMEELKSQTYNLKISSKNKWYKVKSGVLLSKDGKTVYGPASPSRKIVIPNGVKKIKKLAFFFQCNYRKMNVKSIYIPASVNRIEMRSLSSNQGTIITISKKNMRYGLSGDCLYSKKTGRLVAAINQTGTLKIPKEVKKITSNLSLAGEGFDLVVIPKTVKVIDTWSIHELTHTDFDNKWGDTQFLSANPPKTMLGDYFYGTTVYVPQIGYKAYKEALKGKNCVIKIRG